MKNMRKVIPLPLFFMLSIIFLVSGCSDPEFERAQKTIKIAENAVFKLESTLQQGAVALPNINYLQKYAQVARRLNPNMA